MLAGDKKDAAWARQGPPGKDGPPAGEDKHGMIEPTWDNARIGDYLRGLPLWQGEIMIEPLVGGLCNKSFVITDGGTKRVARIGSDILVHGIVQTSVQASMRAAAEIGVTPALRHSEPGLSILDFLEGGCIRPADIENGSNLPEIVAVLKRLHGGSDKVRGPLTYFWPFQVARHYARVGLEKASRLVAELPEAIRIATLLEAAVRPFTPVLTHNDLVPQNFMFDGARRIWLIDWDYGGYGHPLFDIAAIGANADAGEATERRICELYYGKLDDALWHEFLAFKLILNLREYMWGMVQEVTSELDQDSVASAMAELYPDQEQGYEGYTNLNRARFERNWAELRAEFE